MTTRINKKKKERKKKEKPAKNLDRNEGPRIATDLSEKKLRRHKH